ncbi:hypothetical protein HK104_010861 [Borealophlyctis nickersoniae]|nr:hypothetical protein HK104_010861 [Borealophlyctis nickersoniae]
MDSFYSRALGVFVAASAIVAGVDAQNQTANLAACVPEGQFNAAANVDYFPEKSTVAATAPFKIAYNGYYKTITTSTNQTIVLYQCGTQRPADVQADKYIAVPVTSVYAGDTTVVPFIEALGSRETITLSDSTQYITSPCIQALNKTQNVDSANATHALEQTTSANVGFVFSGNASNAVTFPATRSNALTRAQWLHFVAAFYNKEGVANAVTKKITDNYACISDAAKKSASTTPPVVAFTSYSNFQNKESWTISGADFINNYIADAGAKNLTGLSNLTFSERSAFLDALKPVDVLIDNSLVVSNVADFNKYYGVSETSDYKFIKNKQIYQPNRQRNGNGGSQWFEEAVLQQHVVLADFASIITPNLMKNYQTTYLMKLDGQPTILAAAQCPNPTAALAIPDIACPTPVAATSPTNSNAAVSTYGSAVVAMAAAFGAALAF